MNIKKIGHIETIGFTATAPGTSGAAAAAVAGDSLVIKNGKSPVIMGLACDFQGAGFAQVVFPTGHDTTRGMRQPVAAGEPTPRIPVGVALPITAQETMAVTVAGSATAGDVENGILLIGYEEMPGSQQNLIKWSACMKRMVKFTTVYATLAVGTGGTWSGEEALNADSDLLIANREYALLGMEFLNECAAVSIKGPDTAGVRIAVPGSVEFADLSMNYFAAMSRAFGDETLIPVINSANKSNTLLQVLGDENGGTVTVALQLCLLD